MPNVRPGHLTWRHTVLAFVVGIALLAMTVRLGLVQIRDHREYADAAARTHYGAQDVPAPRGAILDATGYPLASSADTWDIYIDAFLWRNRVKAAEAATVAASVLGIDANQLLATGTKQNAGDVLVRRGLPYEDGLRLRDLEAWGVRVLPSAQRVYPEGDLGGSVIGYVGLDGRGLWGIEADLDAELHGKAGLVTGERDPLGRPIVFSAGSERPPVSGGEVQLTIDRFIQGIAERRLADAVKQYKARSGSVLVMDPRTGAILAMASFPTISLSHVDLNDPKLADMVRNRVVTDLYEPGSVLKTLTAATALDMGLITPNSTYNDTGSVKIGTAEIKNWDFSAHGTTTVTEYLQNSLNTGSVWLSGLIGAKSFYQYLHQFGLGESVHVGLSGESEGLMRTPDDKDWYPIDLATNSYGQGLAASPLQVLTAVNTFANGGKLMRPYVISRVVGSDHVRTYEPVVVRQAVRPETATTVARLMYDVVEGVPAHGARVSGYHVAGKTGTTLVSIPTGYDLNSTIASFAGFLPYEAPRVSVLVKIDQPSGGLNLGGAVAAPVFSLIAADIMKYLGVPANVPVVAQR